ncbi:MOSC domain-containing protein [Deinococcus sp. LM3]|uniref:MOSC domain-containing protein n=1 Tax=Deinococcus sp. LM3 TaxID=1938608 RepID=UPI001439053F|nr:MOSC domain-containing protein [Deinococcus sp. LM3]
MAGIQGHFPTSPVRQVLATDLHTLHQLGLEPGVLKEDLVLQDIDLHALASGSELVFGAVRLRLTVHCEPCKQVGTSVSTRTLMHRRGYLMQIMAPGPLTLGSPGHVRSDVYEEIPYRAVDRVAWYLRRLDGPIASTQLMEALGLPMGMCRALPRMLRHIDPTDAGKVTFKSAERRARAERLATQARGQI